MTGRAVVLIICAITGSAVIIAILWVVGETVDHFIS